jgi:LytS/YehU family sensor histidine kinase
LLYLVYRRPELTDPFTVKTAAVMVGLSLVAAALLATVARGWVELTGWTMPTWSKREEWLLRLIFSWFVFLTWSLAFFGLRARQVAEGAEERADRVTGEAQRIELQLLRAQLDPHFLFNSLNNIAAEIPTHPGAAQEMVHELSDYLRYSLENRDRVLAPLASELDAVTAYLKIEQARYGERMEVRVEAEPGARRQLVPSFLLQPLVENAVKHGLEAERCELRIFVRLEDGVLRIEVSNLGRLPETLEVVEGVGLETLRRRLALHYPGRATFELSQMDGVVSAELELRGEPCFG